MASLEDASLPHNLEIPCSKPLQNHIFSVVGERGGGVLTTYPPWLLLEGE